MLFLLLVLVPITRDLQPPGARAQVIREGGRRFLPIAWLCIGVLLVTGLVNLDHRGISVGEVLSRDLLATDFGKVLVVKLGMVLSIVLLSALHDFVLGPRVARQMEATASPASRGAADAPPGTARLRRRLSLIARLNLLLALSVVALGVMLVRGLP